MPAIVLSPSNVRWNWPRVGALSGTLFLHGAATVLLLVPPAFRLLRPARDTVIDVTFVEPAPRIEEPPLPTPPRLVREVPRQPAPTPVAQSPVPREAPPVASSMAEAPPADPMPTPAGTAPAGDVAPTALAYLTRTPIPYPRDAFRARQQGTVVLAVLVGADGVPRTVDIEQSSGSRSLDRAARDAVGRWTFNPGTRNGVATELWARVPISFRIDLL